MWIHSTEHVNSINTEQSIQSVTIIMHFLLDKEFHCHADHKLHNVIFMCMSFQSISVHIITWYRRLIPGLYSLCCTKHVKQTMMCKNDLLANPYQWHLLRSVFTNICLMG